MWFNIEPFWEERGWHAPYFHAQLTLINKELLEEVLQHVGALCESQDDAGYLAISCRKDGHPWHPPVKEGRGVDDTRLVVWLEGPTYPEDM